MAFNIMIAVVLLLIIKTVIQAPDIESTAYQTYLIVLYFYMTWFTILMSASIIYDKVKEMEK